jgi:hypothetical protein
MRLQILAILGLTLAGFALRLYYLTQTHPFFDEYTTVLAARQILKLGWPLLPSGLFYEHGLLSTYVIAPFTALFVTTPVEHWQPAHWGLMLSRWPSAIIGTLTIPLIYVIGRRVNGQLPTHRGPSALTNYQLPISLFAAGLFALSPEGMVWGGRSRMYALATLLVLLTVYWAYRGAIYPAPGRYRWWALLALLALLLTQFGALTLIPPLILTMIVVGWLSYHQAQASSHMPRIWFLRPAIWSQAIALVVVVGLAVFIKRLGQPLGAPALGSEASEALSTELFSTISYQTAFHLTWHDAVDFLAEQFGPAHLFWLVLVTLSGSATAGVVWLMGHWRMDSQAQPSSPPALQPSSSYFNLFLWLIFGLIVLQMVTLLDPFRRNPRYLVMYLPLFYLIAAHAVLGLTFNLQRLVFKAKHFISPTLITLFFLLIFSLLGLEDLRIALVTPEPAYEQAFQVVQTRWQPGDILLTMNTPAAGIYLGQADGFTVQAGPKAGQFLLNRTTAPVDRWLGTPWVGTATAFNAVLNAHQNVWFVIDTIRLPVYFRGDWLAVVNSQMEPVWAKDNALVYRTRPDRIPLPGQPAVSVTAILGDSIQLEGYTLQNPNAPTATFHTSISDFQSPLSALRLTLFWRALRPLPTDYTVFIHLRNQAGVTVVQQDGLSLQGAYPTSRWQAGETVIDPFTLSLPANLPPGRYTLYVGLYRLDTLERLPVSNDTSGENAILLGEINYQ